MAAPTGTTPRGSLTPARPRAPLDSVLEVPYSTQPQHQGFVDLSIKSATRRAFVGANLETHFVMRLCQTLQKLRECWQAGRREESPTHVPSFLPTSWAAVPYGVVA